MASAMTISIQIVGDAKGLSSAVASANSSINGLGTSATKTGGILGKLGSLGVPAVAGIGVAVIALGKTFIQAGVESEQMNAQTVAGLQSTGSAANVTLGDVQGLAQGIMAYSGISDEAVQSGENMLLTFTNIQNGVGAGNDIFNQATTALSDMATKMAGGATPSAEAMSSSAIKLGKALNAPITGMTALSRVGVQFTEAQKQQITTMVEAGDTMGAQKVILAELTTEFGGSAAAMGATFSGQWNIMKETVMNVVEAVVVGVMRIVSPVLTVTAAFVGMASASGLLVPVLLGMAAGWAAYAAATAVAGLVTAATGATIQLSLAPFIVTFAAIAAAAALMFKLVQAGMNALSGGWSKMSGLMKATLIVLAPLWMPIVAAIKLVQMGVQVLVGVWNSFMNSVKAVAAAAGNMWNDFLAGLGPVGTELAKIGDLMNVLSDTAKANADAASASMRSFGLEIVLAAQSGSAEIYKVGQALSVMRQQMQQSGQGAEWTAKFQAGLTSVDNALKAGTLSAADAQKAYMAWGMSLSAAQQRAAGVTGAVSGMAKVTLSAEQSANVMGSAWDKVGPKVAGSMKQIAAAINSSLKATLNLEKNTQTVTSRLVNEYGLTATQAKASLAGTSAKAMQTMAKAGDKSFKQVGTAIQKANGVIPPFTKGVDGAAKAATTGAKGTAGLGKGVEAVGKAAGSAGKDVGNLGKDTEKVGKSASKAGQDMGKAAKETQSLGKEASGTAGDVSKLGSSLQKSQGSVSQMASNVGKLKTELNGLPKSITIQVTVNIKKTGALDLGGVVPGLARGGITGTTNGLPLTMVGESGPELAALPPGTRVFSHNDTMGMLSSAMAGAGGGPQTITGKLTMVNGVAYIEGVVMDVLNDGQSLDMALTRAIRRP